MYEEISPCPKHAKLYDELAQAIYKYRFAIKCLMRKDLLLQAASQTLLDDVIATLRHDNVRFNETRFRRQVNAVDVEK